MKMGLKNGHNRTTEVLGGFKRNEVRTDEKKARQTLLTHPICLLTIDVSVCMNEPKKSINHSKG